MDSPRKDLHPHQLRTGLLRTDYRQHMGCPPNMGYTQHRGLHRTAPPHKDYIQHRKDWLHTDLLRMAMLHTGWQNTGSRHKD